MVTEAICGQNHSLCSLLRSTPACPEIPLAINDCVERIAANDMGFLYVHRAGCANLLSHRRVGVNRYLELLTGISINV